MTCTFVACTDLARGYVRANAAVCRETVSQESMNMAVELHHGLVRKLLRKYDGYGEHAS